MLLSVCLLIPLHSNSFHFISPVFSALPNPKQFFHAHPYPQLFAHLWFCKGKTYEKFSNPENEASAKKVPRHQVFLLLLSLSFSHLERSLHLRGGNALGQAAYPWMLPTFPAILRARSMFWINSNLCFSSETVWTAADSYEARWIHSSYISVSSTALAINKYFFST